MIFKTLIVSQIDGIYFAFNEDFVLHWLKVVFYRCGYIVITSNPLNDVKLYWQGNIEFS